MEPLVPRLLAGAALVAVLALGGWLSGDLTNEQAAEAKQILAREIAPQQAREQALSHPPSYTETPVYYRTELEALLTNLEMPADVDVLIDRLRQPNLFYHPITHGAPVVLKAGEVRTEHGVEITALQEELRVQRSGLETTSSHTMLRLHNRGEVPLAYRLLARPNTGGDCKTRAITQYDALVLGPDEQARISVCPGTHDVEILDLRLMEVTDIGARWIRQVPGKALGLDEVEWRSHKPSRHVPPCSQVPVDETAEALEKGEVQWEDLVDYYSRHDCDIYRWRPGYARIVEPLAELPARIEKQ